MNRFDQNQKKAVFAEHDRILVAAGAGTGKTEVMTERIARLVEKMYDDAADADSAVGIGCFLVLTFTKAATDEMKGRIEGKLRARANDISLSAPKREYLLNQAAAVDGAHIQTFHAFCFDIAKEFHHLGASLDPDSYILSETERGELLNSAFDEVLQSGEIPDGAMFLYKLWDKQGRAKNLRDTVLQLVNFAENSVDFEAALEESNLYAPENAGKLSEAAGFVLDYYEKDIYSLTAEYASAVAALKAFVETMKGEQGCGSVLGYAKKCSEHIEMMERLTLVALVSAKRAYSVGISAAHRGEAPPEFEKTPSHPVARGFKEISLNLEYAGVFYETASDFVEYLKNLNKQLKEVKELLEVICVKSGCYIERFYKHTKALVELAKKVWRVFQEAKQRRGAIDFADQERIAYELLHGAEYGEIFETVAGRIKYIFVDENQDTGAVQDAIVERVASRGAKVFRVGDVKQCIYAFRNADPSIFKARLDGAREPDGAAVSDTVRISLNSNYRTVQPILTYVNEVFRVGMPELYSGADLVSGRAEADDREAGSVVKFFTAERAEELMIPKEERQAEIVAQEIRKKVAAGAKYGDFAVLFRALTGAVLPYQRVFAKYGIPLDVQSEGNYSEIFEINLVLTVVGAIFNPCCDADFVAAASSPFFYMSLDDFAYLASKKQRGQSYCELCAAVYSGRVREYDAGLVQRISQTLEEMRWLRGYSHYAGAGEFIWKLYEQRGFFEGLDEYEDGGLRKANFAGFAAKISALPAGMSIFEYTESLRGADVKNTSEMADGANTVKLMTIHRSKGMGFPHVFCADLQKKLSRNQSNFAFAQKAGIALKNLGTDDISNSVYDIVQKFRQIQESEEQMRVLYVAFTRAKKTLTLVSDAKSRYRDTYHYFLTSSGFSVQAEAYPYENIENKYSENTYPESTNAESVRATGEGAEDADAGDMRPENAAAPAVSTQLIADPNFVKARLADFLEENFALKYGRARHRELELFDFSRLLSDAPDGAETRSYSENRGVDNFLKSEIALRAAKSKRVFKEIEYVNFGERGKDQGIIDMYFVEDDGGIVLVDYKTDVFETESDIDALKVLYSAQLSRYKEVLERSYGRAVKEAYLCLLHGSGRCVPM